MQPFVYLLHLLTLAALMSLADVAPSRGYRPINRRHIDGIRDLRKRKGNAIRAKSSEIRTKGQFADVPDLSVVSDVLHYLAEPLFHDQRVVFSAKKPTTSPWKLNIGKSNRATLFPDKYVSDENSFQNKLGPHKHKQFVRADHRATNPSRRKRHIRSRRIMSVCDSVTEWVAKVTSENIHGNQVSILQEIDIGGARVNQYFYETRCLAMPGGRPCRCRGVDSRQYESRCVERFTWAYAKVQNSQGDRGWTYIKVRAACNCAIEQRRP